MAYETEIQHLTVEVSQLQTRVSLLERQVQFLLGQSNIPYVDVLPESYLPDVLALKQQGKLLDAIKLYRTKTGASLENAKRYVEGL